MLKDVENFGEWQCQGHWGEWNGETSKGHWILDEWSIIWLPGRTSVCLLLYYKNKSIVLYPNCITLQVQWSIIRDKSMGAISFPNVIRRSFFLYYSTRRSNLLQIPSSYELRTYFVLILSKFIKSSYEVSFENWDTHCSFCFFLKKSLKMWNFYFSKSMSIFSRSVVFFSLGTSWRKGKDFVGSCGKCCSSILVDHFVWTVCIGDLENNACYCISCLPRRAQFR